MLAMRQQALPPLKVAPGARTNTSPGGKASQTRTFAAVPWPRARIVIVNWIVLPPCTVCLFATFAITSVGRCGGGAGLAVFTILQTRLALAVAGAFTVIGAVYVCAPCPQSIVAVKPDGIPVSPTATDVPTG
jgi:hypothetical protein